jgi:hypothetical protein
MVEVQTSEVAAIPAPVSRAQQWVKFGGHCWATTGTIVMKQWDLLLEPIVKQQWDWMVHGDIVGKH